jgi:hypothetical protein
MIFYDTETCGLHGPIVLIQYAEDDGDITLYSPWVNTIYNTMELIEEIIENDVIGFNLAFDHFHLCQMYNTLRLMPNSNRVLEDCVEEYALLEEKGRFGPCLKPLGCLDLMLYARQGPYQSTMDRHDIRIKRVPTALSTHLCLELNKRIQFKDVYFARKTDKKERWKVHDIKDDFDEIIPEFKDIVLKFAPSSALKALSIDIGISESNTRLLFGQAGVSKKLNPVEYGYAPYSTAVGTPDDWKGAWPAVIRSHIRHWTYNSIAQQYAEDDVKDTRGLYKYFGALKAGLNEEKAKEHSKNGSVHEFPVPLSDDNSVLACLVGATRWRGFSLDIPKLEELRNKMLGIIGDSKINFNSTQVCKKYLFDVLTETERLAMTVNGKTTTKGVILEELARWREEDVCENCFGEGCKDCSETGFIQSEKKHPAAIRAQEILDFRHAGKELELLNKLLHAGRFHPSFKVIGALSNRMSGSDGLNPQGIKRATYIRECFPLCDEGEILCGGDFAGSQVVIADAVFHDDKLHEELKTGKKIHGLFGECLFPDLDYDGICSTKGLPNEQDKYTRSKNGVFAMLFGGNEKTLVQRVGITETAAQEGYQTWIKKYPGFGKSRKKYSDMFCSMRQPNGIGTKVEWHEPAEYIESIFGFRRYFTLENRICSTLFQLAEDPPKHWNKIRFKVIRRDREQTACGALRSALFAAAFNIQASNMRASLNHVIQSPEASIVKDLQCRLWAVQPCGIHDWRIRLLNIHDELMTVTRKQYVEKIKNIVETFIEETRSIIPLIEIDWSDKLDSWADK